MLDIMEHVRKGTEISKAALEGCTMEDLGHAVYEMGVELKADKELSAAGHKTAEETREAFDKRLKTVDVMVEKLRTNLPAAGVLTDLQSEAAVRKGGLFSKAEDGKPVLHVKEVLDMASGSSLLRGSDAERVHDIKDSYDATVIRNWMEFAKTQDWMTAQKNTTKLPDYKRLERALEAAGYAKTLIHPGSGGVVEDLTWRMLSSEILDMVRIRLRVASAAVSVPLAHNKQDFPANRGDAIGVRGGAANTDPPPTADITGVLPGTHMFSSIAFGLVPFDVSHVLGFLWWSDDAVSDTVIAMVPYLREQVTFAIARAVDRATMSGDIDARTAGNGMDDHASSALANDARGLWNGLRKIGENYLTSVAGVYDSSDFRAQRKRLGIYGLDPAELRCWMSASTIYDLMDDPDVRTMEKFGLAATVKTGVLAMIDGVELIPSEWVPTDTTNGYQAAAGITTLVILANMTRFMLGQLGGLNVESTRYAPMLTTVIQAGARYDFKPIEATTSGVFAGSGVVPIDIATNVTV